MTTIITALLLGIFAVAALAERRRREQDVMIGYIAAQRIKTARRNRRRRGK